MTCNNRDRINQPPSWDIGHFRKCQRLVISGICSLTATFWQYTFQKPVQTNRRWEWVSPSCSRWRRSTSKCSCVLFQGLKPLHVELVGSLLWWMATLHPVPGHIHVHLFQLNCCHCALKAWWILVMARKSRTRTCLTPFFTWLDTVCCSFHLSRAITTHLVFCCTTALTPAAHIKLTVTVRHEQTCPEYRDHRLSKVSGGN